MGRVVWESPVSGMPSGFEMAWGHSDDSSQLDHIASAILDASDVGVLGQFQDGFCAQVETGESGYVCSSKG